MAKKKIPQIVKDIRNTPNREVNYATEKAISYSQMSMYRSCPKKWALHYRDGHKISEQSIHII